MQAPQHALGGVQRLVGQLWIALKRVEQKMRLELELEILQLRARQLGFEQVRAHRAIDVPSPTVSACPTDQTRTRSQTSNQ
jgi:hypothetical protein